MVSHVEAVEAALRIADHLRRGRVEVERAPVALHVGDLPQAGNDTADLKPASKLGSLCDGCCHLCLSPRERGAALLRRPSKMSAVPASENPTIMRNPAFE